MDVHIGTTVDGRAVGFDTSSARPLLLVGDVGRGKTTTARYLTRWWLANTRRHAHVYAQAPSEWADLRCEPEHPDRLEHPIGHDCRPGACLVVVDDMDLLDDDRLALLPLGSARTILTSHGGNSLAGRALLDADIACLGLVRPVTRTRPRPRSWTGRVVWTGRSARSQSSRISGGPSISRVTAGRHRQAHGWRQRDEPHYNYSASAPDRALVPRPQRGSSTSHDRLGNRRGGRCSARRSCPATSLASPPEPARPHRASLPRGSLMSMERSRRARFTNVAPTAGEFTVALVLAGLFFLLITPLAVQCVVARATSGDFALPNGHLLNAYSGLLHGHFGAGLPRGVADALPSDAVMWVLTLLGEVLVLGAAVVVGMWMRDLTGTGSRHGLATPTQAAEALGVRRLRKNAAVIRPDLYARPGRRTPAGSK